MSLRPSKSVNDTPSADRDPSNGWNQVAPLFIQRRQYSSIGAAAVAAWSKDLVAGCDVLDLGCGFGVPISEALIKKGFQIYGIDASPVLVAEFRKRFPHAHAKCEAVEISDFYGKTFDAVVAIGLMFLLPKDAQLALIKKVANSLKKRGRFLFTAPYQICSWKDLLTDRESVSLGRQAYLAAFQENGLTLISEFSDDGENYHYSVLKQ